MTHHTINGHDGDPLAAHNAALARGERIEVDEPIERRHGGEVIDPRDQFARAPEYKPEHLPELYERYVQDCIAGWGGDPGPYAASFLAMHCSVLHPSVQMQTNPLKPNNFVKPNDFSLILGKSGESKSGMFKDLTRFQKDWQKAMDRANAKASRKGFQPMCFLQNGSIEGMMNQLRDNKGDRLLVGCDEAMAFYDGAAQHHKDNNASAMSNAVCAIYDGEAYNKRLVKDAINIPDACGTMIMATVIEKIVGWKAFKPMVESGMMARHTVSVVAHRQDADESRLIEHAERDMGDLMLKMRAMRDFRFVLAPEAREKWIGYRKRREAETEKMRSEGAPLGLVNWWAKYSMRIMSMATIFQIYDFMATGQTACVEHEVPATEADTGKVEGGTKVIKTVAISASNLQRAVRFVGGYLAQMQEFFYTIAAGQTEFGKELLNFIAYRVTADEPDNPACRIILRSDLTTRGPAVCRGGPTPERKELWNRWIQALLDHGFIEVHITDEMRKLKQVRRDCEERRYRVRDEVFEFFNSDDDRNWLREVFTQSRQVGTRKINEPRPVIDL